jgi:hypothetical protein
MDKWPVQELLDVLDEPGVEKIIDLGGVGGRVFWRRSIIRTHSAFIKEEVTNKWPNAANIL